MTNLKRFFKNLDKYLNQKLPTKKKIPFRVLNRVIKLSEKHNKLVKSMDFHSLTQSPVALLQLQLREIEKIKYKFRQREREKDTEFNDRFILFSRKKEGRKRKKQRCRVQRRQRPYSR